MKYQIESWTGRVLFAGRTFESFEAGWDFIYANDPNTDGDDHYYDDYYVELKVDTLEFEPWESIPADLRRGSGDFREVYGVTFLGKRAWIPYVGAD